MHVCMHVTMYIFYSYTHTIHTIYNIHIYVYIDRYGLRGPVPFSGQDYSHHQRDHTQPAGVYSYYINMLYILLFTPLYNVYTALEYDSVYYVILC